MTLPPLRRLPSAPVSWDDDCDVVIVGTGAAGLSAALEAHRRGRRVTLLCKQDILGGATPLAQGGLAAVFDPNDSLERHVRDTLAAAAGIADEAAVRELVAAAPETILRLEALGGSFDRDHLGLEGGHSRRRIVHAGGDASGAEVHRALRQAVADADIEVRERTVALDAVRDEAGAVIGLLCATRGEIDDDPLAVGVLLANAVVLATGGLGQAYATTTNPIEATGDGLALAARAGAELADVEFVQFHPTVLYRAGLVGRSPLVTEALRGAGATLLDENGRSVMSGRHPQGDLAPRDVVSFSMHQAMTTSRDPTHLWLDARALGARRLVQEFPTVTALCRAAGIDPAKETIPVAPGAHYACGGIRADLGGVTSVSGLYAIGEVAATGVHGANRLASNSLTEALIAGERLGRRLGEVDPRVPARPALEVPAGPGVDPASRAATSAAMSRHAGIVRGRDGLEALGTHLASVPRATALTFSSLEATNLHAVSCLVAGAALAREESRGCHRRADAPAPREDWAHRQHLVVADDEVLDAWRVVA